MEVESQMELKEYNKKALVILEPRRENNLGLNRMNMFRNPLEANLWVLPLIKKIRKSHQVSIFPEVPFTEIFLQKRKIGVIEGKNPEISLEHALKGSINLSREWHLYGKLPSLLQIGGINFGEMIQHKMIQIFFDIFKHIEVASIILKREKPNVIHAHPSFPSGFISLPVKLLDIPLICTSHGSDIQVNWKIGYGARRNKIIAKLVKITLKNTSLHTVLNKSMIKDAIEAGSHPSKIKVVYNGIDLDNIHFFGGTDILQRYEITNDDFIVLYLGRFHPKKCPDDLVKAFPEVVKKVPNARLIFAGKGEEEIKLKDSVSDLNLNDNVIFTGFVSEDEKWDLLKRCDVFVLPSAVEGHPITVIEAMACSKPVIATNLGPFPEIIKDGETGLLVPLHSPDNLADAVIELALDENKRKEMGMNARRYVEERFDINKIADDYLKIYDAMIKINKKGRI